MPTEEQDYKTFKFAEFNFMKSEYLINMFVWKLSMVFEYNIFAYLSLHCFSASFCYGAAHLCGSLKFCIIVWLAFQKPRNK
jgi:hypothetical protein